MSKSESVHKKSAKMKNSKSIYYLPKALVAPNTLTAKRQFLLEIIADQDLCLSVLHTP